MINLLDNLIDQLSIILIAFVATFFLWGFGYLIITDSAARQVVFEQCIDAGMQYVEGNCVK